MLKIENIGLKLIIERLSGRKGITKVCIITALGSILGAFVPLIYGEMIRRAGDKATALWYVAGLILVWLVADQIHNWTTRYADRTGLFVSWDVENDLFIDGVDHLVKMPTAFLNDKRLGRVVQRIERGAERLSQIVREVLFSLVPHFLSLIFAFAFMFYIRWELACGVLVVVIGYTLAMTSSNKRIMQLNREIRKMWEQAWGHLWDVLGNVKIVKANTNEEFEINRIEENFNACFEKERTAQELRNRIKAMEHLIFGGGAVAIISGGALMLRSGLIDAGNLFSFFGYITMAYTPFSRLAHNWRTVQETLVAEERLAGFLAEKEEDYQSGGDFPIRGDIRFENVCFSYDGSNSVLRNIDFEVKKGETVAIVGESGVGKTTLVDLLSRYHEVTSGKILIDGRDAREWRLKSLRSQIGFVPQDISLFNDKIRLNIAYGMIELLDDIEEIQKASVASYSHEFIESERFRDNYDQLVGERGIKLSAGQRQRVGIARAIIKKAPILILDEATSALDSESEKMVQAALAEFKQGRTALVIAHRLSTVKNADKIVVLKDGGIVEVGKHDELMSKLNGVYRHLVELQSFQE